MKKIYKIGDRVIRKSDGHFYEIFEVKGGLIIIKEILDGYPTARVRVLKSNFERDFAVQSSEIDEPTLKDKLKDYYLENGK